MIDLGNSAVELNEWINFHEYYTKNILFRLNKKEKKGIC